MSVLIQIHVLEDKYGARTVVFGNRDWVTFIVKQRKQFVFKFLLHDRDLYVEIVILNKHEQTNINDGSRQG